MTSLLLLPKKTVPPVTTTALTEVDIIEDNIRYIKCSICGLFGGTLVKIGEDKYRHEKCPRGTKWYTKSPK